MTRRDGGTNSVGVPPWTNDHDRQRRPRDDSRRRAVERQRSGGRLHTVRAPCPGRVPPMAGARRDRSAVLRSGGSLARSGQRPRLRSRLAGRPETRDDRVSVGHDMPRMSGDAQSLSHNMPRRRRSSDRRRPGLPHVRTRAGSPGRGGERSAGEPTPARRGHPRGSVVNEREAGQPTRPLRRPVNQPASVVNEGRSADPGITPIVDIVG